MIPIYGISIDSVDLYLSVNRSDNRGGAAVSPDRGQRRRMRRIFQLSVGVVLTEDLTWALGLAARDPPVRITARDRRPARLGRSSRSRRSVGPACYGAGALREGWSAYVSGSVKNRAVACDGGVCQGWQTTGFLRDAGSHKRRKFLPQPPGAQRMRCAGGQERPPRACAQHGLRSAMVLRRSPE